MDGTIREFLKARPVAVVGASNDRSKYGNIIFRDLRGRGWLVYPINPGERSIEGEEAFPTLADTPLTPGLAVMVTPPAVSLKILDDAAAAGVERIWFQDGSCDVKVLARAAELGLREVHGACIMVMAARPD